MLLLELEVDDEVLVVALRLVVISRVDVAALEAHPRIPNIALVADGNKATGSSNEIWNCW